MNTRRLITSLAVSLVAGGMISTVVAWRCVAYSTRGAWRVVDIGPWLVPPGEEWQTRALVTWRESFGVREDEAAGSSIAPIDGGSATLRQYALEAGWPWPALQRNISRVESRTARSEVAVNEEAPQRWAEGLDSGAVGQWLSVPPRRWLPVVPVWPGMLVNSLLFGAVAWVCGRVLGGASRRAAPLWAIWRGRDDGRAAWRSWEERIKSGTRLPRGHAIALLWLMRGRRRAKRRHWPVAAIIAVGLGVTVAVAWGCAALAPAPPVTIEVVDQWAAKYEEGVRWQHEQEGAGRALHRGPGLKAEILPAKEPEGNGRYFGTRWGSTRTWSAHCGWPWHALAWETDVTPSSVLTGNAKADDEQTTIGWRDGLLVWRPEQGSSRAPVPRRFPFMPIWTGLALDTLVWSAAVAVVIAPLRLLRRARRIGRAACPSCGYEVGIASACTECGMPLGAPATNEGASS